MNWESLKEQGQLWYTRAAQFFFFQNILMYLFGCITAHTAIGLPHYIDFLDHCCHWYKR